MNRRGRATRLLLAAGLAGALAGAGAGAAAAGEQPGSDDVASISYVEAEDGNLSVLVSVPAGAEVDLEAVTATVAGEDAAATAAPTGDTTTVRRTTVLAMDTSNSMRGERFEAARAAADTFLETVPDDVEVGIVTFDSDVEVALEPGTDRDQARAVVAGLSLSNQTMLYRGVLESVAALGEEGQRKVLLLSDGADTSETPLTDATAAVEDADVLLDVVALEQAAEQAAPLRALAEAGSGEVISADSEALRSAFAREAEDLARQVLVTIDVPDTVTTSGADVAVSLPTGGGALSAEAYASMGGGDSTSAAVATEELALALPAWAMYAGIGGLGIGMLFVLLCLVPRPAPPLTAEDRIARFAQGAPGADRDGSRGMDTDAALASAKGAADSVLRRNRGLEERVQKRLEGAGSSFKPSEWLLLQVGIFLAVGLVGVVVAGGNPVISAIFAAGGVAGPWFYLGLRRNRRVKAFNAGLPDTLSLMSGSLSAGLSLAQSVDTIVREGSEPIAGEFKRVLVETRLGVPLEDALEGITDRFESEDFAWVVMAIKIQRQVGGNLAELLDTVAATMRERQYLRRQVTTLSAEGQAVRLRPGRPAAGVHGLPVPDPARLRDAPVHRADGLGDARRDGRPADGGKPVDEPNGEGGGLSRDVAADPRCRDGADRDLPGGHGVHLGGR